MWEGQYLKSDLCPEGDAGWTFHPKKKNGKVDVTDIVRELHSQGMTGNLYALLLKIPEEWDYEQLEGIDVYDDYVAAKILANACHYTMYDDQGRLICGPDIRNTERS